jgi:predicted pyridoxine 5'-phosphate oxidase superfamily flavin-nucleotide-binding protein
MVRFDGVSATEDEAARPPWNAEILVSLLPNTTECLMIPSRSPAMTSALYHQGNRTFQDEFGSRRLADRLEQKLSRTAFTDDDKIFIESCIYFFMATADASGHPDCSFKGGAPGFVRVTGPSELAFPDYDGNGMFKSIGNLAINPHVGLLFIAMHGTPKRLRINGNARIDRDDPLLPDTIGAQLIVRIEVDVIFPNCPRYIPSMTLTEPSIYVPHAGVAPVEPAWKGFDAFRDVVPPRAGLQSS